MKKLGVGLLCAMMLVIPMVASEIRDYSQLSVEELMTLKDKSKYQICCIDSERNKRDQAEKDRVAQVAIEKDNTIKNSKLWPKIEGLRNSLRTADALERAADEAIPELCDEGPDCGFLFSPCFFMHKSNFKKKAINVLADHIDEQKIKTSKINLCQNCCVATMCSACFCGVYPNENCSGGPDCFRYYDQRNELDARLKKDTREAKNRLHNFEAAALAQKSEEIEHKSEEMER